MFIEYPCCTFIREKDIREICYFWFDIRFPTKRRIAFFGILGISPTRRLMICQIIMYSPNRNNIDSCRNFRYLSCSCFFVAKISRTSNFNRSCRINKIINICCTIIERTIPILMITNIYLGTLFVTIYRNSFSTCLMKSIKSCVRCDMIYYPTSFCSMNNTRSYF